MYCTSDKSISDLPITFSSFTRHIAYRYDERYRILNGHAIRLDFYLPELDVYIESWGMDTAKYKLGMLKKPQLYQQEGKRLISIHPSDKPDLDTILRRKLSLFGYTIPPT